MRLFISAEERDPMKPLQNSLREFGQEVECFEAAEDHSRLKEFEAIVFTDTEFFRNQQFSDGREKTVLFGSRCVTATGEVIMQDRGGWLKRAGRGWLLYFQPGHDADDFGDSRYVQVLDNSITRNGTGT